MKSRIATAILRPIAGINVEHGFLADREQLGLHEELEGHVYRAFAFLPDAPMTDLTEAFAVARGHRPSEIALAGRIAAGDEESLIDLRPDMPVRCARSLA